MKFNRYTRVTAKQSWNDDEKRELSKLAKKYTVAEIAERLGKTERGVINMSSQLGCGYRTV